MATKMKKQQKKKRWEGSGLVVPPDYVNEVASLADGGSPEPSPDLRRFAELLQRLIEKGSTYAEIEALKPLCSFTAEWATRSVPEGPDAAAAAEQRQRDLQRVQGLLAGLLLLPNSRPLHKQLLSGLRPLLEQQAAAGAACAAGAAGGEEAPTLAETVADRIAALAEECIAVEQGQCEGQLADSERQQAVLQRALRLGSALAALLAKATCKPALLRCAVPAVAALAAGLRAGLLPGSSGNGGAESAAPAAAEAAAAATEHITADVMEGLQDCISAMYYLLTAFGRPMLEQQPAAGAAAITAAGDALLGALQGQALVREALASAAVALYAAAALPAAPPAALARCFARGLMLGGGGSDASAAVEPDGPVLLLATEAEGGTPAAADGAAEPAVGLVDAHLRQRQAHSSGSGTSSSSDESGSPGQGGLAGELSSLPPLNRICAIRGLLAATPAAVACAPLVPRWSGRTGQWDERPWLLLVNGALPAIEEAIQSTTDEHFKFHGFSTLAVCLERIRHQQQQAAGQTADSASAAAGETAADGGAGEAAAGGSSEHAGGQQAAGVEATPAVPLLNAERQRQLLHLLWQGFEAPLSQTLQRAHVAFECLLDIIVLQQQLARDQPALAQRLGQPAGEAASTGKPVAADSSQAGEEEAEGVLLRIARDLLALDASRKGRYAPLQALVPRVGAARLVALQPGLVPTCLEAVGQHLISSSAAGFFLALLAQLQREARAAGGPEAAAAGGSAQCGSGGAAAAVCGGAAGQPDWRAAWLPDLVAALRGGSETQRDHLAAHLLPHLLTADPPALGLLLQQLLPGSSGSGGGGGSGSGSEGAAAGCLAVLKAARKQQLLCDLDSLPVAGLDAAAVRAALLAAVRSSSEGLRVDALTMVCCHPRTTTLPTGLELEVAAEAVRLTLRCPSSSLKHKTLGPLGCLLMRQRGAVATALSRRNVAPAVRDAVAAQRDWLHWLGGTLLGSLYPGASHERSFMALEILGLLLDAFADLLNPALAPPSWGPGLAVLKPHQFQPFAPEFCSQGTVQLLLAAAMDSWERLREAAAAVLLRLPSPLPGTGTPAELQPLLLRALRLLGCPRGREADAGAQLVVLLLRKYGGGWAATSSRGSGRNGCAWLLDLAAGTVQAPGQQTEPADEQQADGRKGQQVAGDEERQAEALWCFLSSGCRLLEQRVQLAREDMLGACRGGLALGVLLALRYSVPHVPWRRLAEAPPRPGRDWTALVERLLQLTYAVAELTLPVLSKPQDQNMDAADVDADDVAFDDEGAAAEGEGGDALGPRAQIINTACWQSSKECGLLLGALARALPIGGATGLLSSDQLGFMADYFTNALCCLKHNGAVDKTQQGFAALCERLLQQADPALRQLPQRCLHRLLEFARRPDQGRGDIVRRSAGLPFAVVAIFYSEPDNSQKVLLQRGMAELLATANDATAESWPRVHALNCMRATFQDATLAVDTSAFLAEGLQTAILGMAAPQWEVRNAASLCYTALLVRVLGFRNAAGKGTPAAKRAPTAPDFFARHPQLHPFLLRQLAAATAALEDAEPAAGSAPSSDGTTGDATTSTSNGGSGGGGAAVHPAMFPVLVLLSRLRSSQHNRLVGTVGFSSLAEQQLSPAAFAPLLQRCAAARPAAVRALAAAALPPLLPPERQPAAAAALAEVVAEGVTAAAGASRGGSAAALRPSYNSLHGQLLQLRALLEAAASSADAAAAAALLGAVAPFLTKAAPAACLLGSGTSAGGSVVPAAVSLEYIRAAAAAAELLPLVRRAEGEEAAEAAVAGAAWLGAVQRRCWMEIERSGLMEPPGDYCSPMLSCTFKHATQLCFSLLLQQLRQGSRDSAFAQPGGSLLPQLATALRSLVYEVRGAALKVLLKQLQQHQQPAGAATAAGAARGQQPLFTPQQQRQLRALLKQQLAEETHHKAQRRLLALLALLPPGAGEAAAAAGGVPGAGVAAEFSAMMARAKQAADSRVRQHAVECLGPLLSQLLAQQGGMPASNGTPASPVEPAAQLLEVAADCAQPRQLPELRLAAAVAVASSSLLQLDPRQSQAAAEAAAGAWRVLLMLLEDEDEEVREVAARAASAAMAAFSSSGGSCTAVAAEAGAAGAAAAAGAAGEPASPSDERVLRRLFPALAARFGAHPALLALLRRLCCPSAAAAGVAGAAGPLSSTPAAAASPAGAEAAAATAAQERERERAARIFDREPDNMHEEPVLVAQLAAATLARLLPHTDAATAADVQAWAAAALNQLQQAEAEVEEDSGVLQDPDQFADLYRCWLALWAAAHLTAGDSSRANGTAAAVVQLAAATEAAASSAVPQLATVAAAAAAAWQQRIDGAAGLEDGAAAELCFLT